MKKISYLELSAIFLAIITTFNSGINTYILKQTSSVIKSNQKPFQNQIIKQIVYQIRYQIRYQIKFQFVKRIMDQKGQLCCGRKGLCEKVYADRLRSGCLLC